MNASNPMKQIARDVALWLYGGPFRVCIKAIPLFWVYRLAEGMALFYFLTIKKGIESVSKELCKFTGGPCDSGTKRRIAKKACQLYVKRQLEDLFASKIDAATVHRLVSIKGRSALDQTVKKGKGGIVLVSHFGSFRMILPALAFNGYRINQLVGNPNLKYHHKVHRYLFGQLKKEYNAIPVKFIRTDLSIRPAINALKNNEFVVIAFDGREGNDWVEVPFLGRTGKLSAGPVRIAAMTGAVLIPTVVVRKPGDRNEIIIHPPFEILPDSSKERMILRNTIRYVKIFEKYMRKYPCHFAMTVKLHQERYEKGIIDVPMLI